jgi:hypothetical protein
MRPKRILALMLLPTSLLAQERGAPPAPKNLKVLTPDVNVLIVMQGVNTALGVQCNYCHVQGDFASDQNPKKEIARKMFQMLKQVSLSFPDNGNDFSNSRYLPFPEGKQYVTCYTCHQGALTPASNVPDWHGPARAPEPGVPAPAGGRGQQAGGRGRQATVEEQADSPQPAVAASSTVLPSPRGNQVHKNVVWLPRDMNSQFVMPAFRAAIGVECNFCHVAGESLEKGHAQDRDLDLNPKKLIARNMIHMVQKVNAVLFPEEDIDIVYLAASSVPEAKHFVTCYTCHRGNHIPPTAPATERAVGR